MKKIALATLFASFATACTYLTPNKTIINNSDTIAPTSPRPNIIFIIADDLGYGDLGVYGQEKINTPNIDQLAKDGMKFTQHYAGATVCGPSRASLLTGLHGGHAPIRGNPAWTNSGQPVDLTADDVTIAKMLQSNGYNTGAIGKWGMAESDLSDASQVHPAMPLQQGFDYFFGVQKHTEAHHYYWHRLFENNTPLVLKDNDYLNKKGKYTQDLFTEKALAYINQQTTDKPFFLYIAYMIPHLELTVPEDSKKPYLHLGWPERKMEAGHYRNDPEGNTTYAGMVSRMDSDIGRIQAKLKELGLDENTLIIFTSDNGHEYDQGFFNSNGVFRGGKRDLYEGGIRIPFIAKWPNKIAPSTRSDHISAFWDMMPTFCELSAAKNCPITDGLSLVPTLTGQHNAQQQHEFLYWEFNEQQGPRQAIRRGDWKLIKQYQQDIELYNLATDIGEQHNLASKHPDLVDNLLTVMHGARTPHPEFTLEKLVHADKRKHTNH